MREVIAVTWWMILIVALGILGIVFGVYVLVRRIGWFVNGFVRGLLSELAAQPLSDGITFIVSTVIYRRVYNSLQKGMTSES